MKLAPILSGAISALLLSAPLAAQDAAADFSQDTAWHNRQQVALAERNYRDGWRYLDGGVMWRWTKQGNSSEKPTVRDTVTVHYAGTFIDGAPFDSSYDRGEPATFPLGRLIKAWQLAIPQMAVGDTIEIATPSALGYGPIGKGQIPGGATLLFTIELLGIEGR